MTCKKCEHNNSQIVSTVQQQGKKDIFFLIAGWISLIIAFLLFFIFAVGTRNTDFDALDWALALPFIKTCIYFLIAGIVFFSIRKLIPYKTVNVLYVVCKECGHVEKLQEISDDINNDSPEYWRSLGA